MVMAEYFVHDRLQELWQQINHLHLTYLHMEDSPQKIEQRNKLEACIRDFLCLAPHNRKFCCQETAEVLHRSASKKDFSGYRAALGWNAVSMYAGNLLSQPWRKEYRQIKTYSGFYKYQIEANLAGAEAMFEAMGYKYVGNGILVLEGPVCPDRLTNVSQDSIVAFVECQILKTIWEEVWNNFEVSWLDVLEFRESHLCSPEQSIRMLNYRFHEKRYQEQQNRNYPQGTDTYSTVPRYGVSTNNHAIQSHIMSHAPPITGMHSYPPSAHTDHSLHTGHAHTDHSHLGHIHSDHGHIGHAHLGHSHLPSQSHYVPITSHVQPCPAQCSIYGNPYYNYSTYAPVVPASHFPRYGAIPYPVCPPKGCNGFCYPNGCIPAPAYVCPVPTGQLIELEGTQNGMYDATDGVTKAMRQQQDYLESHKQLAKSTNLDSLTLSKSKEDGAGTFESWDYVYRNLESQGYSKDLGERGDVLQETRKKSVREAKKTKPSIELEDAFNSLNLNCGNSNNEHNLKVSDAVKKYTPEINSRHKEPEVTKVPQSSSYDNITQETFTSHKAPAPKSISNGLAKTKTLPRERLNIVSPEKPNHTLDTKKLRKQDVDKVKKDIKEKKRDTGSWNCNACTYLNSSAVEICDICGKSKKTVEVTMAVGGSQCPRCTLVNPRECNNCQACDMSLLNSPTYI